VLLWLHAAEHRAVIMGLLRNTLDELAECDRIDAFHFATPLWRGLEALPVNHRPITHRALLEVGFTGTDSWRYMHRDISPADKIERVDPPPGVSVTHEAGRGTLCQDRPESRD
jgi:hypothetical protein